MNEWSIIDINSLIHDFKNWLNISDDLFSNNHQQIPFQEFLYCAWYLMEEEEEEAFWSFLCWNSLCCSLWFVGCL